MVKNGVLDGMKAEMRSKLLKQLKAFNQDPSLAQKLKKKAEDMEFKLSISLIFDFLQKNDMAYTMSVLAPESGIGSYLSKSEIEEILKISTHES